MRLLSNPRTLDYNDLEFYLSLWTQHDHVRSKQWKFNPVCVGRVRYEQTSRFKLNNSSYKQL